MALEQAVAEALQLVATAPSDAVAEALAGDPPVARRSDTRGQRIPDHADRALLEDGHMRLEYDHDVDAAYLRLRGAAVASTEEIAPGVLMDLADDGRPVGFEVLDASEVLDVMGHLRTDADMFTKRSRTCAQLVATNARSASAATRTALSCVACWPELVAGRVPRGVVPARAQLGQAAVFGGGQLHRGGGSSRAAVSPGWRPYRSARFSR
jgi:uncharacterized protein YuzE